MAKEGSVAPKERVNIVYKPETGGAQEEVELPLKLLMLGDYTLRDEDTPVEDRKPINIDKDNFNDVMGKHNLSLDLNVPNQLSGQDGDELSVSLSFEKVKDFDPESVARQVPELAKVLELREALVALKGPLGNVPTFRRMIQAALSDDDARDKLLKELNIGEGGEE
ncbi:MAG: type VI secretion system contractile sheath small subunit [Candidatus Thiodiazotropha sp.]